MGGVQGSILRSCDAGRKSRGPWTAADSALAPAENQLVGERGGEEEDRVSGDGG